MDRQLPLTLKDIQKRLLVMWRDIETILSEEKIQYFLSFGSLLGAVRHEGFIPWDDDFDIHIHQDDYSYALVVLQEKLPQYLRLDTQASDMAWDVDCRIVDQHTRLEGDQNFQHGLCIDIFTADRCHVKMGYLHGLAKQWKHWRQRTPECFKTWQQWVYPVLELALAVSRLLPGNKHWFVNDKISATIFANDTLWPLATAQFENEYYNVPANSEQLLSAWYGDYMTPLPVSEREGHFTACYFIGPSNQQETE